jgi:dCMP deaminase
VNILIHIKISERMAKLSKWEQRWVDRAKAVAEYSKDKNTKTGAVIVTDDNTELTMGYNGFPRGADDDNHPQRYERPDKYFWTEHAERNALYKAARIGMATKGANMFCTYFPCADCSRAIIQGGIKKLYVDKPDFNHHKWGDSWVEALIMLKECGVEVVWTNVDDDEIQDTSIQEGN